MMCASSSTVPLSPQLARPQRPVQLGAIRDACVAVHARRVLCDLEVRAHVPHVSDVAPVPHDLDDLHPSKLQGVLGRGLGAAELAKEAADHEGFSCIASKFRRLRILALSGSRSSHGMRECH